MRKLSGLFINCVKARDSIYESGRMVYQCISDSEKYTLDYLEITRDNAAIPAHHDFYLFNYHLITMSWLDVYSIKEKLPGIKMTIVLEVSPNDPFVFCPPDAFDAYCVLDPTLKVGQRNVFAFPRPLEIYDSLPTYKSKEVPVIGSFGFATEGKGFEHVIAAVNYEFDRAVVRINIPFAAYLKESERNARRMADMCSALAKPGIEVNVTHDFMTKSELIGWCANNTINCFLYDRNMPGLAATTDQAITSGRPLVTSKNNTFRHIETFIRPFPYQTLKEAIENTQPIVDEIQRAWSPQRFREKFEGVLTSFDFDASSRDMKPIDLTVFPPEPPAPSGLTYEVKKRLALRTRLQNFRKYGSLRIEAKKMPEPIQSFSRFGEDLAINDLFEQMSIVDLSYLEINTGDPSFISHTNLFYKRGFRGLLVETDPVLREKLIQLRPEDIVLNNSAGIDLPEAPTGRVSDYENLSSLNISEIIEQHFTQCPDLVSLNAETLSAKLLETFDFKKNYPAIVAVSRHPQPSTIDDFFLKGGYSCRIATEWGFIFVNKNLYDFSIFERQSAPR